MKTTIQAETYPRMHKQNARPQNNLYHTIACKIAYALLWNGQQLSRIEEQKIVQKARQFFACKANKELAYEEIVQRIIIACIKRNKDLLAATDNPVYWFHPDNERGFAGTLQAYHSLTRRRIKQPGLKKDWLEFAGCILQLHRQYTPKNWHQWRSHFAQINQRTLNMFLAVTA